MFTNTVFEFDGEKSTDYGLILANIDTNVINAPFGMEREIIEDRLSGIPTPYFFKVEEMPLYFNATLAREKEICFNDRVKIARWLFKDEYRPFISLDHQDIIFNCIVVERPEKILIGNIPIAIELMFRCDAPWAWSPFYITNYDMSNNNTHKVIAVKNRGSIEKYNYPEIWIKALEGGCVSLINNSDGGREFKFDNLQVNETIYINNYLKQIESNIDGIYRLKDFNRNWLRLVYGINQIKVTGKCQLAMRMRHGIAV